MRPIKFRAWLKEDKVMEDVTSLHMTPHGIYISDEALSWTSKDIELLEFIGLFDKNGKEIYEGYIVTCEGFGGTYIVEHQGCMFEGKHIESDNTMAIDLEMQVLTIIGNIYENPELVEKS